MDSNLNAYQGVWTLGEVRDGEIHPVSYELLAWGRGLADKLGVDLASIIIGHEVTNKTRDLFARGADKVYVVDHPALNYFRVDSYSRILAALIDEYKPEILIASATTTGRTLMPVMAVKCRAGLTADCTGLDIDLEERLLIQTRPAVGGNIMATIKTPTARPQMSTVRPKSKRPLAFDESRTGEVVVKEFGDEYMESRVKRLDFIKEESAGVPIQEAEIVVAVGKGLRDQKNMGLINELAALLKGSVGASRGAVDLGWISYSHQVGLSGKTVSPKLYLACGVSGAVQHLAGMSSSETVVAVNKDPEAGIFSVADFGLIGDLGEVIPVLIEKLKQRAREEL